MKRQRFLEVILAVALLMVSGRAVGAFAPSAPITPAESESPRVELAGTAVESGCIEEGFTITANSCSLSDMQTAIDTVKAADGGIVYVPAGTCDHGRTRLRVPSGVSLIGAGQDQTVITNALFALDPNAHGNVGSPTRISGFHLSWVSQVLIHNTTSFRLDYSTIECSNVSSCVEVRGSQAGVIDHCTVRAPSRNGVSVSSGPNASAMWGKDVRDLLGQPTAIFIEDNIFEDAHHAVAGYTGAHYVFRHNYVTGSDAHPVDAHGPQGSGYGTRVVEVYENEIQVGGGPANWKAIAIRGGDGVVFNNTTRDFRNGAFLVLESGSACPPDDGCECYPLSQQVRNVWVWGNDFDVTEDEVRPQNMGGTSLDVTCYIEENRDYFLRAPSQELDGFTYTPYIYPHPLTMCGSIDLALTGTPADQAIHLNWTVDGTLPVTSTWRIDYYSETVPAIVSHTGIASPTRAYPLTGLENGHWYTVTLSTVGATPPLSDTVAVQLVDHFVYLPLITQEN